MSEPAFVALEFKIANSEDIKQLLKLIKKYQGNILRGVYSDGCGLW